MRLSKISESVRSIFAAGLLSLFLSSCASVQPKPVTPVTPGKEVETLQSEVSLSVTSPRGSSGGQGYLVFKRPDRFRLVVLAPFGITMGEVFVEGEKITYINRMNSTAYAGTFSQIRDNNALRAWSMMRWVIENPPMAGDAGAAVERIGDNGVREYLHFDARGLLEKKTNDEGDEVLYRDYRDLEGVAFPATIQLTNRMGDRVKVSFNEPEVNQPVDDKALTPDLEGMTVLPIEGFKGL